MRFKVVQESFDGESAVTLVNSETGEFCQILPFLGGAINSIGLCSKQGVAEIVDGYRSLEEIQAHHHRVFKGANLFPFPNRVADGKYCFADVLFHLPINFPEEHNAIHGLLYAQPFTVLSSEEKEDFCSLKLEYLPENPPSFYPFYYRLEHLYAITKAEGVRCTTRVENLSDAPMPLGHGWHPYFQLGSERIDELLLCFPAAKEYAVGDNMIPTGEVRPYGKFSEPTKIGDTRFDHCFSLRETDGSAELLLVNEKTDSRLKICLESEGGKYGFLQIYTPPERKTIALEPMTCPPDSFNNMIGLVKLSPGQSISFSWAITLEA